MTDLMTKIDATTTRIVELQKLCAEDEVLANDHEQEARAARKRREENKKELQQLNTVLNHAKAAVAVQTEHQAAQQSRADAEALHSEAKELLASLKAQKAELDAAIAKAKEP